MANIERLRERRFPLGRIPRAEPTDPKKILRIVHLREKKNMHWHKISEEMGISRQGLFDLYRRWRGWAYAQEE